MCFKDDTISRQAAIDEIRRCRFVVDAIEKISKLPSAQPEWNELLVVCDNCGYAIHVKRLQGENDGN